MHNINKEHLKQELTILVGFGVGLISIITVTGVAYYLSMYQILGG